MPYRILFFLLGALGLASCALASDWTVTLAPRTHLPQRFIAVDKEKQQTFFVDQANASSFGTMRKSVCTTGQRDGDKRQEGDLKTPEGIYFVEEKISGGLYYPLYGNTAYPLNYPNPVDRVQGKTGYGIWLHGRGTPLDPKVTRGCVALPNDIVDNLDAYIQLHRTPVCIAQRVVWKNSTTTHHEDIIKRTWSWINAREHGEERFFDLYDPELLPRSSGTTFAHFRDTARSEFTAARWTDLRLEKMHVLEGPDYMVSFFPLLTVRHEKHEEGWCRLYWMRRGKDWKIVGEERVPATLGLGDMYEKNVTREIRTALSQAEWAWDRKKHHELTALYSQNARRGQSLGISTIALALVEELQTGAPNPYRGTPHISLTEEGISVLLMQQGNATREFLFRPAKFDTWTIIREQRRLE